MIKSIFVYKINIALFWFVVSLFSFFFVKKKSSPNIFSKKSQLEKMGCVSVGVEEKGEGVDSVCVSHHPKPISFSLPHIVDFKLVTLFRRVLSLAARLLISPPKGNRK